MARFFPFLPPRSASFSPQRRSSLIGTERSQDVLCPLHQQRSQIGIAFFADVHLRLALPGVSPPWLQSEVATHVATLAKAMRVFQRQHEGQRDQCAHTLDLLQQFDLRITLLRQLLDASLYRANLFAQRLQRRQQTAAARIAVPDSALRLSSGFMLRTLHPRNRSP